MNNNEVVCSKVSFELLKELGPSCFALYMTLLNYRDNEKNECHPTIKNIGEDANINEKTVKRNLKKLYENKYINIDSGSHMRPNEYYFPKEEFYKEWKDDDKQQNAKRRTSKSRSYKDEKQAGIYLIRNTITDKKYVGQSVNIRERWKEHIFALRTNTHCNKELQSDYNEYGENNFDFEVLEVIKDSPVLDIELDRKEKKWGEKFNVLRDGYNKVPFSDPFN